MTKNIQRKICLENRKQVPNKKELSLIIVNKLKPYLKDKNIMSYYPYKDEVDVSLINDEYDVSLPVIVDQDILAYKVNNNDYQINKYNILEPNILTAELIDKKDLEVIIVPLVGFDEKCFRLGHGKGYYDRFLKDTSALKIGVAFEVQKMDKIIIDKYDIQLDMIISENNIYKK